MRDGIEYQQTFKQGGKPDGTFGKIGKTRKATVTSKSFLYQMISIFLNYEIFHDTLSERLRVCISVKKV